MNTTEKKLNISFPSDTEVLMTRSFEAPRSVVYECFTKCEHLAKWWGWGLIDCEMDLRVGGKWKRITRSPDGQETVFNGEYKEIAPNERLSYTMNMPYTPELLETIILEDQDNATKVSTLVKWPSKEMRDGAAPHMEKGAGAAYDKLEELLTSLQ